MTTLTFSAESEPMELVDGRWRVVGEIARGGMGVVYEGVDVVTGENVALKVLKAGAEQTAIDRFAEEARAAACIDSPHVVRALGAGCTGENAQPFLAMELLKGEDLGEYISRKGPLPLEEAATYVVQACEALERAHAAGIIHRDIKPSNLFRHIGPGGVVVVKIVDFGISKSLAREETLTSSKEGAILGSPPYMSPEQIRDARAVDHRTDIWSLGIVLYRLLTGGTPWGVSRIDEVFARILSANGLPSLAQRGLPAALDEVIARCVAPNREDRWPDAGALARALTVFTSAPSTLVLSSTGDALPTVAMETLQLSAPEPPAPKDAWHAWLLVAAVGIVSAVVPLVLRASTTAPAAPVEDEIVVAVAPVASLIVPSAPVVEKSAPAPSMKAPASPVRRASTPVVRRNSPPSNSAQHKRELQPNPYSGDLQ